MYYYSSSLFPDDSVLSPDKIREMLDPSVPRIRGVVSDVFGDLQLRRSEDNYFQRMTEGDLAWWMYTQIQHESKSRFVDDASLEYQRKAQQSYLVVGEALIVVIKKLRRRRVKTSAGYEERLERSNYRTHQNMDVWAQRAVQGFPDLPRAIFGFEMVAELTSLRYYIGIPQSGQGNFKWTQEIQENEVPVLADLDPVPDIEIEIEEPDFALVDDSEDIPATN